MLDKLLNWQQIITERYHDDWKKNTCQARTEQDRRKHHLFYNIYSPLQFDMANQ
jgi:hypothetical protein